MNNANTPTDHTTTEDTTEDTVEIHPGVLTGALFTGLAIAVIVGAASFKLSFSTLFDLAVMTGAVDRSDAWVIPVALDGPILACAVTRIALSQHTDPATKRGRRLVVAVLTVSAILSIAGNAYHAVLTATVFNAAVAAAIAALAPAMVLTMSEIVAVVLRAPRRRRRTTTVEVGVDAAGTFEQGGTEARTDDPIPDIAIENESAATITGITGIDEDLDNGLLKPAVWTSVDLYLAHSDWSLSDIARHLELHTSTVSRHIKTWTQVQQNIAAERSTASPAVTDRDHTTDQHRDQRQAADDDHDRGAEAGTQYHQDDEFTHDGVDRDYVGAVR